MGQIMEIEIHGSGSELQGVGHAPDGRAVFVKGALPGERVRVRETRVSARFMEAELQAVLSPSPHRRAPNVRCMRPAADARRCIWTTNTACSSKGSG